MTIIPEVLKNGVVKAKEEVLKHGAAAARALLAQVVIDNPDCTDEEVGAAQSELEAYIKVIEKEAAAAAAAQAAEPVEEIPAPEPTPAAQTDADFNAKLEKMRKDAGPDPKANSVKPK